MQLWAEEGAHKEGERTPRDEPPFCTHIHVPPRGSLQGLETLELALFGRPPHSMAETVCTGIAQEGARSVVKPVGQTVIGSAVRRSLLQYVPAET